VTLRNPIELALNPLHVALRKAADYYRDSAEIAEDPALAALLRELASKRQARAQEVEEHIRQIGLPRMPDPERLTIGKMITHVMAAFSDDRRAVLLKSQQPLEQEIAQASVAALQEQLPEETRQLVHAIAEDVINSQDQLANLSPPS
jgi:uncharacterized protein (TIGR02284 family)